MDRVEVKSGIKNYTFGFGKFSKKPEFRNKTLGELPILELDGYRGYLEGFDDLSFQAKEALGMLNKYFEDSSVQAELDEALREAGGDEED